MPIHMPSLAIGIVAATALAIGIKYIADWLEKKWNIPIIILRFVGNKGRPNVIVSKGHKENSRGATRLYVKGYKMAIKDFRSELYFPSPGRPHGALILYEVDDALLTPCVPTKEIRDPETRKAIDEAISFINERRHVKFSYDEQLYHEIKLKAVDDTDIDWMTDEIVRVKTQYKTGFLNFLQNVAPFIMLAIVCVAIVVGMVLFFKEAPNLAKECLETAFSRAGEMCSYQQQKAIAEKEGTTNNEYVDKLIPGG